MRTRQFRFENLSGGPPVHPGRRLFLALAAAPATVAVADDNLHDPPLEPRDEAIYLLHAAAEIEHALMVQYLFAAYSLRAQGQTAEHADQVEQWRLSLHRELDDALTSTSLPEHPDYERANEFLIRARRVAASPEYIG